MIAMESLLIKAKNVDIHKSKVEVIQESVFKNDLDLNRQKKHLGVLVDVVHQILPEVKNELAFKPYVKQ